MNKTTYLGVTLAYRRFSMTTWKTESLLDLGVVGINEKVDGTYTDLLGKLEDVKGVPGPKPKSYEPQFETKKSKDGNIELTMDARSANFIKNAIEADRKRHDDLRFFLYSNIFVSVWGAFETYSQMLFEEILSSKPEMLKSNEVITLNDVVSNRSSIVEMLVEKQVETIGHFKIDDLLKYYKKKVNYSPTPLQTRKIRDYYFVRNVIAHKSGILRESQRGKLPSGVKVSSDEIQLSEAFLKRAIKDIEKIVKDIELVIEDKFFKKPNKSSKKDAQKARASS